MNCPTCGAELVDPDGDYCSKCGSQLKEPGNMLSPQREPYMLEHYSDKAKSIVVWIEILISAMLAVGVYIGLVLLDIIPDKNWSLFGTSILVLYSITALFSAILAWINFQLGLDEKDWDGNWWLTWEGQKRVIGSFIMGIIVIGFISFILFTLISEFLPDH